MKIKKYIKNKKVLATILSIMISFSNIITIQAETKEFKNEQARTEYKIENKTIGIKNRGEMSMRSAKVMINGKEVQARKMTVTATAYTSAKDEGGKYAYNGQILRDGHIAADFSVLPLGTKVYIPQFNKVFTVVDKGSAIKKNKIDIWMQTKKQAWDWGIRTIDIYVLD